MHPAARDDQDLAPEGGATPNALTDHPVVARLLADPTHADFFFAVRWLSALVARAAGSGATGVGEGDLPSHEPLRFGQEVTLAFAPSTVRSISVLEGGRFDVGVRFFGLSGPQGPLPLHISEIAIRRRLDEKDNTLEDFFNIFNDRMIEFYYRSWAVHQMCVALDAGHIERFDRYVGSLAGYGRAAERERGRVPARAILHYAGLLGLPTKPIGGLESLLSDDLQAPVVADPFTGAWVEIPRNMRCCLGDRTAGSRLGVTTVLGEEAWEVRQRFSLRIGPIDYGSFRRLLPGRSLHDRMSSWAALYSGAECACTARLVLKAEETPPVMLGDGERDHCRLGQTTWLRSRPFSYDPDDAVVPVVN